MNRFVIAVLASGFLGICGVGCSSFPMAQPNERLGLFDRSRSTQLVVGESDSKIKLEDTASLFKRKRKLPQRADAREVGKGLSPADFQWPLESIEITSPFGRRGRTFHEGVDLKAKAGTPVFAVQDGRVIYSASKIRGYGQMIVIRHRGKLASIYAHNSKLLVKRGDSIKQGQKIAESGNSGKSTGPHLHFELRKGLTAMNPMGLLPSMASRPQNQGHSPAGRLTASNQYTGSSVPSNKVQN